MSQIPSHSGKPTLIKSSFFNAEVMDTQFSSPYASSTATIQSPVQSILSDDDEFVVQHAAVENSPMSQGTFTTNLGGQTSGNLIRNKKWPEPDCWCTISYYELNSRVGDAFTVNFLGFAAVQPHFSYPLQMSSLMDLLASVSNYLT